MKSILNKQIFYNFKLHLFIVLTIILTAALGLFYYDFHQIAQSESGIFFYPSYLFKDNISPWSSYYMGQRSSLVLPYLTFIFRFTIDPDFPHPFISQFGYYLILFYLGFLGLYLLLGFFEIGKKTPLLKLYLSTIIIFNPAALSVLLRFQYPYITFYFIFPLLLYLSLKVFNSKTIKDFLFNSILLNLLLSLFSMLYATMPTLVLIHITWFLLSLFYIIKNFNLKYFYKIISFYVIWISLNSFWLIPLSMEFAKTNSLYSSEYKVNANENLSTLQYFSKRDSSFVNIFSLHIDEYSKNFFNDNMILVYLFRIVNLIPVFIIFYYIIKSKNKLNFKLILNSNYLVILFLLFIFFIIVWGLNFPFSSIYAFIFQKVILFQTFRNNFEKGILLFYLPFLIIFLSSLIELFQFKIKKMYFYMFIAVYILTNSYLMFSSKLLLGDNPPFNNPNVGFKIEVPNKYKDISNVVNNKDFKSHNTLVLPLVSEGITYNWDFGYIGVDILHQILSNRTYSFISPDNYQERVAILKNIYFSKNKVSILDMFNFKSLVFRNDYDYLQRSQGNPEIFNNYFLSNFTLDRDHLININNYSVVVSSSKNNSLYIGNIYTPSDGAVNLEYDRENFVYLRIGLKDEKLLPIEKPFVVVIKSQDTKKIDDFELMDTKKHTNKKLIFSNSSICKDCFVSEILFNTSSTPITSITMRITPKERGTTLRVEKLMLGNFIENWSLPSGLSKVTTNIYKSENEVEDLSCYSKYEIYTNISKFIYEDFDPNQILYIKDSEIPEKIKNKNLEKCNLIYSKLSNSEYEIEIKPSKNSNSFNTILDFKNSADSYWKLFPEDSLFGKLPFDNTQFISNTYSNSFYLENIPVNGVKFKLIYLPQIIFNIFVYVSGISWFILIIFTSYFFVKKNKK